MPYRALRNREGRAYITHIDDPTPEEKEEEDRLYRAEQEADPSLAPNSNETARDPEGSNRSSSTIEPLSSGAKREFFIYAHPREMRSTASMPYLEEENTGLDPLTPESSSHDARWRRQNRITSYREITWPVTNSRNVIQTQDPETLHLEKQRRDTKHMSDRYYLQKTGRSGYAEY
jgi:hypothetical protein